MSLRSLLPTPLSTVARRITATFLCAVLVALGIGGIGFPHAAAATISVSPPRFELFGNPGDTVTEKIKLTNPSDAELTYQVDTEDFVASGDEGGVDFVDKDSPTNTFSLAKWVTVEPTRFTIAPGEEKILNYTVRIPRDAEPGGHYASVLVRLAGGPVTSGGASVQSRVGSLLLMRVSGAIKESLALESFKSDNRYYQNGPVDLTLRSRNDGNVHVAPSGTIVITNLFGKKVKEIPLNQANVLPGASRNVKTTWDQRGMIGYYTASLVATYGQNKQTLSGSTTFYVVPPLVIGIVIGAIVLIFLLITQRKSLKRIINRITSD